MIKVSAPGKLILIGEYVVLEGAPALVSAVNRFAEVQLEESNDEYFTVNAPSIGLQNVRYSLSDNGLITFTPDVSRDDQKKLTFFKSTFEYAWQYCKSLKIVSSSLNISINTDSFYSQKLSTKLGFGSSAAMTVALVKALFKFIDKNVDDEEVRQQLFRVSLAAHKNAQGNVGSGIDVGASAFGGVLQYRVGINNKAEHLIPEKVEIWNNLPMLTVFTGSSESTRKMVFGVNEMKKKKPDAYRELMIELESTSKEGCEAYKSKNLFAFLNSIKTYHVQMNLLGKSSGMPIISPVHQQIARMVHQSGGAYKPSGAGSGDIGIAFAESFEQLQKIRNEIEKNDFHCIDVKIA